MASIRAFTCNDVAAELDYIQDYGLALKAMRREITCLKADGRLEDRIVRNVIKLIAAVVCLMQACRNRQAVQLMARAPQSFQQDHASMEAHIECLAVLLRQLQRQGTQLSSSCRAWLKQ